MLKPVFRQLFLTLFLLLLVAVLQDGVLDRVGHEQTEAGFKRALLVFAVSRGLNGVISVAQGTEVAVVPVGIGLNFKPGEILDPINDLVERFSWVMLASSAFFGVQRLLLEMMASTGFTVIAVFLATTLIALIWWPGPRLVEARRLIARLAIALLILRVSVTLVAIGGEQLYQAFLEPQYNQSRQQLEQAAESIGEENDELQPSLPNAQGSSLLDDARRAYESATRAIDIKARMAAFNQAAANISEHAINLIVVFLVQTLLFPLLSIWLLLQLIKGVMRARLDWLGRDPKASG